MKATSSTILLGLVAVAALAMPAAAVPIEKRGYLRGDVAELPCAVRVDFTSVAAGPDITAFEEIRSYLADQKRVYLAEAWSWGREGEFSLCLHMDDAEVQKVVFDALVKLAPQKPNGTGGRTVVVLGKISG
jgi:hypothetical protein